MQRFTRTLFRGLALAAAVAVFIHVSLLAGASETGAVYQAPPASKAAGPPPGSSRLGEGELTGRYRALEKKISAAVKEVILGWRQWKGYMEEHGERIAGGAMVAVGMLSGARLTWQSSVLLYCYDGGDRYRRVGRLHLKKRKHELELKLPGRRQPGHRQPGRRLAGRDSRQRDLQGQGQPGRTGQAAGASRYRLIVKSSLVKKCRSKDLVVKSRSRRLRQPLEECVDFML